MHLVQKRGTVCVLSKLLPLDGTPSKTRQNKDLLEMNTFVPIMLGFFCFGLVFWVFFVLDRVRGSAHV